MHFFQLIQQSAQHIYHSALPLSPKSSIFSSMSLPEQTRISDFYGRPDHWGSVVRTITSISGWFTCITTIGRGSTAKIVGACNDGTVRIYDSVTGVLRLSLRPEFPVQEMTGLPDGSLLVCTHIGRPLITLWDIQTGGLVQTFILKGEAKGTTVSLKGRYLACEASEGTVNLWETASRTQHPVPQERFRGNTPCWLAPEEMIMVVDGETVYILNIITKGPPVHRLDVSGSVHSAVYSQTFNRLVIMFFYFRGGNSFTTVDVKTGTFSTLHSSGERLSSIAFSQTTEQLVCGGKAPGLDTVDISTGCRTRFDFPATATSISTLSNGTVVANVQGSGIQLLQLNQEHVSPRQPTPSTLTVYPLDGGSVITTVSATNDRVMLQEAANLSLSHIFSIPTQQTTNHTVIIYASLKNKVIVLRFTEGDKGFLQMWKFSHQHPLWTVPTSEHPSTGSISPAGTRLVTLHNGHYVCVWDACNGCLMVQVSIGNPYVSCLPDIAFDSEDRFYLCDDTYREPYDIVPQTAGFYTHSITRLEMQVLAKRYRLDKGREWVVCRSQRICWISPRYIGSAPPSHWWDGSSLVLAGQDGILRSLTFRDSSLRRV